MYLNTGSGSSSQVLVVLVAQAAVVAVEEVVIRHFPSGKC
jgi:hypothetical protein